MTAYSQSTGDSAVMSESTQGFVLGMSAAIAGLLLYVFFSCTGAALWADAPERIQDPQVVTIPSSPTAGLALGGN